MTLQKCTKKNQHNPSIKLGRGNYAKATNMPFTLQLVAKQNSFQHVINTTNPPKARCRRTAYSQKPQSLMTGACAFYF